MISPNIKHQDVRLIIGIKHHYILDFSPANHFVNFHIDFVQRNVLHSYKLPCKHLGIPLKCLVVENEIRLKWIDYSYFLAI